MSHDLCIRIELFQHNDHIVQRIFLRPRAGIGRTSGRVPSPFPADADTVPVEPGRMVTRKKKRKPADDPPVAADPEMKNRPCGLTGMLSGSFSRAGNIAAARAAMNHDVPDLPGEIVYRPFHRMQEVIPITPAMEVATAMTILRRTPQNDFFAAISLKN